MLKQMVIGLMLVSNLAFAANSQEDFEQELKLPEAHYNTKTGKTIVEVDVSNDYNNQRDQEDIIKNIEDRVGVENLIIVEKPKSNE